MAFQGEGAPDDPGRRDRRVKHGMHGTPEYRAWQQMLGRCYNPNSQRFDRYGRRGIRVCERWKQSFEAFYEDVGPRPSSEHSIDRIDNDGDYEPGNCRWATRGEQNRNKADIILVDLDGRKLAVTEWARELGLNPRTILCRIKAGMSPTEALSRTVEYRRWPGSPGTVEAERINGARIREERRNQGISLKSLQEKTGLSRCFLGDLEHGKRRATESDLKRISEALGVDPVSFFRAEIQEEINRERRAGAPAPRCVDCGGALAAGRSPGYCRDCDEYHRWMEGRSDGR
jgi:hypothetical protein